MAAKPPDATDWAVKKFNEAKKRKHEQQIANLRWPYTVCTLFWFILVFINWHLNPTPRQRSSVILFEGLYALLLIVALVKSWRLYYEHTTPEISAPEFTPPEQPSDDTIWPPPPKR